MHGHDAASYRRSMGLGRRLPLSSEDVSAAIAGRQRDRYRTDEQLRAALASGQQLARTGVLGALASGRRPAATDGQGARARRDRLDRGRATTARRRADRRAALVAAAGAGSIAGHLASCYAAGASLETLRAATGMGRANLRQALIDAGVTLRATGSTSAEGRRSRAVTATAAAAAELGLEPGALVPWLRERRQAGDSVSALARRTGRSTAWVRSRLATG